MKSLCTSLLFCLVSGSAYAAQQTVHRSETNGLYTWTSIAEGFSIELIQVVPDFIRAIYSKHDFPREEIEEIAGYCVYGSIIRNTSDKTLRYSVSDWRVVHDGTEHTIKTKTQWLAKWRKAGVVFSWTLLPDEGTFYEGDWQQGFTTVKLPRDSEFDLVYRWSLDGVEYTDRIEDVVCSPEEVTLP